MDPTYFASLVELIRGDIALFRPEIWVALTILAVVLGDLLVRREDSWELGWWGLFGTIVAGAFIFRFYHDFGGEPRPVFFGMAVIDTFGNFFRFFFLAGTAVVIALTMLSRNLRGRRMGEYYGILLSSVLGAMLLATANDLLMVYLGIEMVSIPSFVLVLYDKNSRGSSEASLKYIIYGAVSSGAMIYGASLIYGLTGTTRLDGLAQIVAETHSPYVVMVAAGLLLVGFAYKLAMFPLHFWCPDAYEGAPTSITAFLSVISKAAGFAVFLRFLNAYQPAGGAFRVIDWGGIIAVLAAITMTYGNLAALYQTNLKRLLAYSSIAHVGYMLMGVAAFRTEAYDGFQAVAFYLVAYLFMNLGAFAVIILVENQTGSVDVTAYQGLARRAPFLAVAMSVFLFSLIGLPPTAGFVGKFTVFLAAVDRGLIWLVVIAALNTAVSVYYYAKVFKTMCLEGLPGPVPQPKPGEADTEAFPVPTAGKALVLALLLMVLYLGIFFSMLQGLTQDMTFAVATGG